MGRPTLHDPEALLDAALLIAADGPERLTMAAVARSAGAPSGSVYHRFASRPALLGALWVRTVSRFQSGFLEALGEEDPARARASAARHVVSWSRKHPEEARALLHGASAFDAADWPEEIRSQAAAADGKVDRALKALAGRTPGERSSMRERLTFVTVDAPYAVVRRHLRAGRPIPRGTEGLVEQCARTLGGTEMPAQP